MKIEIRLALQSPRQASGLRQWSMYVREEVFKKIPGMTRSGEGWLFAGTLINIEISVDSSGTTLAYRLTSASPDGKPLRSPPIPALVFLLGMLRIAPGHAEAGRPMKFACTIGDREYPDTQWEESNRQLSKLLPVAYYAPYVKDLQDPGQFFKKKN